MKKITLDDEYEKSIKLYQYYASENQPENLQENFQKYEKSYDSSFHNYDDINDMYFVSKGVEHLCNKCDMSFSLRNKLFKHLRETCRKFKVFFDIISQVGNISSAVSMANNAEVATIIHFIAKLRDVIAKPDYNFRNWKYVTFKIRYSPDLDAEENDISPNSECEVIFDDRAYLVKNVSGLEIRKMAFFISVRGVGNKVVSTNEYVMVIVYVNDVINDITRITCFTMKMHLINDLKINILLETNIMTSQEMTMNLKTRIVKLGKCQRLQISIDVIART